MEPIVDPRAGEVGKLSPYRWLSHAGRGALHAQRIAPGQIPQVNGGALCEVPHVRPEQSSVARTTLVRTLPGRLLGLHLKEIQLPFSQVWPVDR